MVIATSPRAGSCRSKQSVCAQYVFLLLFATLFTLSVFASTVVFRGEDHVGSIPLDGDPSWYQDLGGEFVTEIQDQDLFFHDIGPSISHLKTADIVMIGSSLVAFAIDGRVVRKHLEDALGLKFYNMSFVGIPNGEFSLRIAQKHGIWPRLWVINADDGGGGNFFSRGLSRYFSADVKPIAALEHGRLAALREVGAAQSAMAVGGADDKFRRCLAR
jgi:hypothetical protein